MLARVRNHEKIVHFREIKMNEKYCTKHYWIFRSLKLVDLVSSQVKSYRVKNSVKEIAGLKSPQAFRISGIMKLAGDSSNTSSLGVSRKLILCMEGTVNQTTLLKKDIKFIKWLFLL